MSDQTTRPPKEWVSIAQAEKILGISSADIKDCIENGGLPFRKRGSRDTINIEVARAYFIQQDVENMKRVQRAIAANPMSRNKVTGDIDNRKNRTSKIRPVDARAR